SALLALAIAALGGGLFLAWNHPVWPVAASSAFAVWVIVAARYAALWLFLLPAALPLANFSPWSGWIAFEEFDLMVLGAVAGGFARLAGKSFAPRPHSLNPTQPDLRWRVGSVLVLTLGVLGLLGFFRGVADAGGWAFGWFDGYAQPLNGVRAGKNLLYAVALWPLLRYELRRSAPRSIELLSLGMQVGLALVGCAVLWERAAYPGLLDFSSRYRATALFWEMHVGGGTIDAYLALATPFAAWALWRARTRRAWAAAALLALLTVHACLTTFSRGAYVGVGLPLLALGAGWWLRRLALDRRLAWLALCKGLALATFATLLLSALFATQGYAGVGLALAAWIALLLGLRLRRGVLGWRKAAALGLMAALITEGVAVVGGGSFLRSRLLDSDRDFGSRLAHWERGVALLTSPAEWLLGLGVGRLPANYARFAPRGEFSGDIQLTTSDGRGAVMVSGPPTRKELAGLYALTQRVPLLPGGTYRVGLVLQADVATDLFVSVCEQHLLYARHCQQALVRVLPREGAHQSLAVDLRGPVLSAGDWYAPRLGVFALSVARPGASVLLSSVALSAPDGSELLGNRNFARGLAQWFPAAEHYFLPWHIDSLWLELLIERGLLGALVFAGLFGWALQRLCTTPASSVRVAPFLAASLGGGLIVGLVSSVMDTPRVAFLFCLLALFALALTQQAADARLADAHPPR
ncbi:MAG: hypothetical protein V4750_03050, partial [Pseudomonadota bacterium]